jgi:hypothetical protein
MLQAQLQAKNDKGWACLLQSFNFHKDVFCVEVNPRYYYFLAIWEY